MVGGADADGPVMVVERYDAGRGAFEALATPSALVNPEGWTGAAAVALPDGRVAIVGGPRPAYVVYDPALGALGPPGLFELRLFHAAVALDADRVLVAGGCSALVAGACAPGAALRSTRVIDLRTGELAIGPNLAVARIGATAWLEPAAADGTGGVVVAVAGGVDAAGAPLATVERIDLATGTVDAVAAAPGQVAPLDGGGALIALAPTGAAASGAAYVATPGGGGGATATTTARADAVLVTLEDGRAVALGGDDATTASSYLGMTARWREDDLAGQPPATWRDVGAARLADGTVLVVGGVDGDGPSAGAWLYRAGLLGTWSAEATVTPSAGQRVPQLSPWDPTAVDRGAAWILRSTTAGLGAWALVSGPRSSSGRLTAVVRLGAGGVAVIAASPRGAAGVIAALVPGAAATVATRDDAIETPRCAGAVVPPLAGSAPSTIVLEVDDDLVVVRLAGAELVRCTVPARPPGLWGVGALGDGAAVTVDTISFER
ncbi:MAG: hypothetical protein R2939_12335 [Kofleriaceae bacterium]